MPPLRTVDISGQLLVILYLNIAFLSIYYGKELMSFGPDRTIPIFMSIY
jgi:hypothetical protein